MICLLLNINSTGNELIKGVGVGRLWDKRFLSVNYGHIWKYTIMYLNRRYNTCTVYNLSLFIIIMIIMIVILLMREKKDCRRTSQEQLQIYNQLVLLSVYINLPSAIVCAHQFTLSYCVLASTYPFILCAHINLPFHIMCSHQFTLLIVWWPWVIYTYSIYKE